MEFQFRELAGQRLVGGDGEVDVADIERLTVYPTAAMVNTKGQGAVGAVALVGWVLLLMSGIPVPPVLP